jgi:hypothetical protein
MSLGLRAYKRQSQDDNVSGWGVPGKIGRPNAATSM